MNDCDLCHEEVVRCFWRGTYRLCESCAHGVDYEAGLTKAERLVDRRWAGVYVDESESQ